uniref:Xaa-Pro dipeptidyl-peptidase C-terminal domain-containing protein n=1 Tax=Chrysotila carterae TaxID=13221 RepID=A0A7S4B3P8_CHRCT
MSMKGLVLICHAHFALALPVVHVIHPFTWLASKSGLPGTIRSTLQPNPPAPIALPYKVEWISLGIPSFDGILLRARIGVPQLDTSGKDIMAGPLSRAPDKLAQVVRFPVVLMANSWSMPNVEYFGKQLQWAERGYIVVEYDARGWWGSGGDVDLAGPDDMRDISALIDYVLKRQDDWHVNVSAIATCGISYGGGLAVLGAAHDARVVAAASLSGWGNLTDALYPNETPNKAWEKLLVEAGRFTGRFTDELTRVWAQITNRQNVSKVVSWADRRSPVTYARVLASRHVPVFISNNFEDRLFRPEMAATYRQALEGAGVNTFFMLNQGIHAWAEMGGLADMPHNAVFDKVLAWLDCHLKGIASPGLRATPVALQPRQLSLTGPVRKHIFFDAWPAPAIASTRYSLAPRGALRHFGAIRPESAEQALGSSKANITSIDFVAADADDIYFSRYSGLSAGIPIVSELLQVAIRAPIAVNLLLTDARHSIVYMSAPILAQRMLCGTPNVTLFVTPNRGSFQLLSYLYAVDATGMGTLLTHAPRSVWEDEGVVPGAMTSLHISMRTLCTQLSPGVELALGIDTYSPAYTPSNTDAHLAVRIHGNGLSTLDLPWLQA